MTCIHDPDGTRLPIKLDSTSNGEYEPIPLDLGAELANRMAHEAAGENAKRTGRTRRDFLVSSCGVASTLLEFNAAKTRRWADGQDIQKQGRPYDFNYAIRPGAIQNRREWAIALNEQVVPDVQIPRLRHIFVGSGPLKPYWRAVQAGIELYRIRLPVRRASSGPAV